MKYRRRRYTQTPSNKIPSTLFHPNILKNLNPQLLGIVSYPVPSIISTYDHHVPDQFQIIVSDTTTLSCFRWRARRLLQLER